jgi:pimeloyl-ACP methyl ester carboxylesterase
VLLVRPHQLVELVAPAQIEALIVYTINSYILQQNIPNAQLILYPDAGHGALFQYPERFVRHVSMFLSE